ncbi:MAG: glycogen synthase GlgA [Burkholderiales bacterium]
MRQTLRVLYVTPELSPWVKEGGLGDVSSDLPAALARTGIDARILVPAYPPLAKAFSGACPVAQFPAPGGVLPASRLLEVPGPVTMYLLDCAAYFARSGGVYQSSEGADWPDNHLRFGLLSRIAARLGSADSPLAWLPDIVHCNDWQTGLAAAYLAHSGSARAATVMTIHNLAYQGIFPPTVLEELAVPREAFAAEGLEYHGKASFLKAGLHHATLLNTVSPTYAREIQTAELGFGLDGLLRRRAADLSGILNGIDTDAWNPARDPHLARNYDALHLEHKRANKTAVQRAFGLRVDAGAPLLGMVSRLVEQKGVDLVAAIAPELVRSAAQLVVLGRGGRDFEAVLEALAARHPGAIAAHIGFDERRAHQIEAGADLFLMPSRFEPCGLNQFYSMRYGTPPVARRTGGLADSVVDATEGNLRSGTATGFTFDEPTPAALLTAIRRAIAAWREPGMWRALQRNGMARDFGWAPAAQAYAAVYRRAIKQPRAASGIGVGDS